MNLSGRQHQVMSNLLAATEGNIRRHGASFRLADINGQYLQCVTAPTVRALRELGLIQWSRRCPSPTFPEWHDGAYWPTARAWEWRRDQEAVRP